MELKFNPPTSFPPPKKKNDSFLESELPLPLGKRMGSKIWPWNQVSQKFITDPTPLLSWKNPSKHMDFVWIVVDSNSWIILNSMDEAKALFLDDSVSGNWRTKG